MIPLYFSEDDAALITQIETDLVGTVKTNGRDLPIRNPIMYASVPAIVLNSPCDPRDDTYEVDDVAIQPMWDENMEPHADRDGSQVGEPREVQKIIRIRGWVRAPSLAKLYDNINALNRAFNPVLSRIDDYENEYNTGFLDLDFYVPTDDGAYASGFIPQKYKVRSIDLPVPSTTKFDDFNARFEIVLRTADGRRYHQTESTATRTGNGNVTANNTLATYPSWPIIDLDFTTAVSTDITIERTNNPTYGRITRLVATALTDSAGKVLRIDMQARTAKYVGGADKTAALRADSRFFDLLHAGNNTITFAGLPSDCDVTVRWNRAYA
jgi:hypothetical protein